MKESRKAMIRRWKEDEAGIFPWKKIFSGDGVDVGSGDDPIAIPGVKTFDTGDGDANKLSDYFPPASQDFIHGSQICEHLHNPHASVRDWLTLLKPDGHLIITVPAMELYGDMLWGKGPNFNQDHKSTWSLWMKGSPAPIHILVPEFVKAIEDEGLAKGILVRLVDTNYDYKVGFSIDQSFIYENLVECWIEIVLKKSLA